MSEELKFRVGQVEKDLAQTRETVDEMDDKIDKVVDLLKRVQYMAMGIGVYFILDNLGVTEAIKLAMKAVK